MTREIWLRDGAAAVVEDGRLVEYFPPEASEPEAQRVLLGKVDRVVPGLEAAFVEIGEKRCGFLPLRERSRSFQGAPMLQCGDRIPVQIKREAQGEKGALLTRDLCLCGSYVLLMPLNRYIGVSAQVEGADRERLKELGHRLSGGDFGLVMRLASRDAAEADIRAEIDTLWEQWQEAEHTAATAKPPCTLIAPGTLADSLQTDYAGRGGAALVTDVPDADWQHIQGQMRQALGRRISMPGGGSIVIDECEALTAIDVNTASDTGDHSLRQTILQTNRTACEEIARQVRLRNLSGILIIDFIDMETDAEREQVRQALAAAFAPDRVKTVLHGFTTLGLMEMTRRRSRKPLAQALRDAENADSAG